MVNKAVIDDFIVGAKTLVPRLEQVWIYIDDAPDYDVKLVVVGDFVSLKGLDAYNKLKALQAQLNSVRFRIFTPQQFRNEEEAKEIRRRGRLLYRIVN